MREAAVLAKLNHPNIIRMYGVVVEPLVTQLQQQQAPSFSRKGAKPASAAAAVNNSNNNNNGVNEAAANNICYANNRNHNCNNNGTAAGGGVWGRGEGLSLASHVAPRSPSFETSPAVLAGIMTDFVRGGSLKDQLKWVRCEGGQV